MMEGKKTPRQFVYPQPNERQIRNAIIDLLNWQGYMAWTNNTGAFKASYTDKKGDTRERNVRFSKPGMSDIFAVQPKTGRFVAIEVKTPKAYRGKDNGCTPWQLSYIESVNIKGGIAFVACSTKQVAEVLSIPYQENSIL